MTFLVGEDYSRYFELPPHLQGLEIPRGAGALGLLSQEEALQMLKEDFAGLNSDLAKAGAKKKTVFVKTLALALETLLDQPPPFINKEVALSDLKLRPIALSTELATIHCIYQLAINILKLREMYSQLSANERCLCNFGSFAFIDRALKSSEAVAFAYRFPRLIEHTPPELVQEIKAAAKHSDKEISDFANFILLRNEQELILKKINQLGVDLGSLLTFSFAGSTNPNTRAAAKLSHLEIKILLSYYNDLISFSQGLEDNTLKCSFRLTDPTDEELKEKIQDIEEWSTTLPEKIREYETIWKALEEKRNKLQRQSRIDFLNKNMQLPPLWNSPQILEDCYGLGRYKVAIEKLLSDVSSKKESINSQSSSGVPQEKEIKSKQKRPAKKSQGKKGKKTARQKKPAEKIPSKEALTPTSLPETNPVKVDLFDHLKGPPREHYSQRVLSWIEDENPFHLTTESYLYLSPEKKAEQHRRHGFSLEVDKFIEDNNYSKSTTWQNPTTGNLDRRVFIAGEMEHLGETQRGFFTFCYGIDKKIYHRHFTTVSTEELLKSSEQSTYNYDFPSLAEAAALSSDTPHQTRSRQKERSEEAIPGAFGSAVIYDGFHDAKITLFKRPEQ